GIEDLRRRGFPALFRIAIHARVSFVGHSQHTCPLRLTSYVTDRYVPSKTRTGQLHLTSEGGQFPMYLSNITADSSAATAERDAPWYRRRKLGYVLLPII